MAIDFNWLEEYIFHRTLTEDEKYNLETFITIETFKNGTSIVVENEPAGALYLLRHGEVDVVLQFNGETVHIASAGEGSQLGDMAFLDDATATATLIAKKDCVTYKITRKAIANLFARHQAVARDLLFNTLANMSSNLRELNFSNAAATQYIRGCRV
ncbi:MAG: cyclic nucleotide-binding domain-containing protein [Mariprofundaceae bacterium]|nr:cyclic nucleotide-binding domain-containing protein [Mariprofundaceae bacterium]